MAKIIDPLLFSQHFDIDPDKLDQLGVFNLLLNVDAKLFIDPLLLEKSKHQEMKDSVITYNNYFHMIIKLLAASTDEDDIAWRNAKRYFSFHEIKGTCMGYGT